MIRLLLAGIVHHRRIHLAVALGVMAATAVLTGALVVGDSVRGSLRHLLLDRLGRIDEALVTPRFFRRALADELNATIAADPALADRFDAPLPAILLEATVENPATRRRATHVTLAGSDQNFWSLDDSRSKRRDPSIPDQPPPGPLTGEIFLNAPLADDLGLATGDECLVRLPLAREVPADSPLGRKTETSTTMRLKVTAIVAARGLGEFNLRPNQAVQFNAYVNEQQLAETLEQPGRVNALLVPGRGEAALEPAAHEALQRALHPTLADLGLTVRRTPLGYDVLESDRMLLEPQVDDAARKAWGKSAQPALTYLANTLAAGDREIPYSTVTAIDFSAEPPRGPFLDEQGQPLKPLADGQIALNRWAADRLQAKPGELVRLTYFKPETTHGQAEEATVDLQFAGVVELAGAAADPNLTPTLPGVTDQLSIADWNPPFPFDSRRIRREDEDYWDDHKATPKAFVSLRTGRNLWGSRFGETTSWRIAPGEGRDATAVAAQLEPDSVALGFAFQPVKRLGLEASRGTTSFQGLFLGFSFFIIAAALALVTLLFRLGVEQRADEIGLLEAVGWRAGQVRRLLLGEGLLVATVGALAGVIAGVGYAALMLAGLRTWWLAAITSPFLSLHVDWRTLLTGYFMGVFASLVAIAWSLRQLRHTSVRSLLAGQTESAGAHSSGGRWRRIAAWACLALAIALAASASGLSGEAQAGTFFGSGGLVLVGLLLLVSARLRAPRSGALITTGGAPILRLAARNAARHPGRSTLSIGLVAAASFLIVAISAFRLDPNAASGRSGGTGGFALVGESDQPIFQNLDDEDGLIDLGFPTKDRKLLAGVDTIALRVRAGDDASCLNLYQSAQPRVLGVPRRLIDRGGFAFSANAARTPAQSANPWLLLDEPLADDGRLAAVPVILDEATAKYSLHLAGVGDQYVIDDGRGGKLRLEVVGLLKNSVLQGSLLIGETEFLRRFPETSGYRFFLIDAPTESVGPVREALERTLGDFGFAAQPARDRLAGFLNVQNTYLSTFQSLGGLGLLLGTLGLAAVQLRSVLERRGELALLRAAGFRRALLARMVLYENVLLLIAGLAIGVGAALVAVLPHWLAGGAAAPWLSLAATLALVLATGVLAGLAAVRATIRAPLLPALRGE